MQEKERASHERAFLGDPAGGLSIDEFLSHSSKSSGGGSYLSNDWKAKGRLKFWLHTLHTFYAVWSHTFYRVLSMRDRDKGTERSAVVPIRWNCRDYRPELGPKKADKLLSKARYRLPDGSREHAPVACPCCKFEDWLAVETKAGRIGFAQPIFRFDEGRGRPPFDLYAGGIVGLFNDKMTDAERATFHPLKLSLVDDAWKQKTLVKLAYLLVIVDDDDPEDGAKKYFAPEGTGDKIKATIRKEIARRPSDPERGNPILNPYPIVLTYNEDALPKDRYDASVLEEKPSEAVLEAISEDKLDLTAELEPGNCAELRMLFEQHALIKAPWDEFFHEAERAGWMTADDRRPKRTEGREEPVAKAKVVIVCDVCDGKNLPGDRNVACPDCGAGYGGEGLLSSLRCLGCKSDVAVPETDGVVKCASCAAPHDLRREGKGGYDKVFWSIGAAAEEPKKRRQRRKAAEAGS